MLSRALLVAGGALAGTAAAWALSAAPASAETLDLNPVGVLSEGGLGGGPLSEVLSPVDKAVDDLDAAIRAQREALVEIPRADLGRVAEDIRGAVGQVGGLLGVEPVLQVVEVQDAPRVDAALAPTAIPALPEQHQAPAEAEAAPVAAPETPAAAEVEAQQWSTRASAAPAAPVERSRNEAPAAEARPAQPVTPDLPSVPVVPASGTPAHCSCGADGASSSNNNGGALSTIASTSGVPTAAARALLPATERNTAMPGKQPGITPD
ncbi:hypothetical protein KCV87_20730 [Actinosynnema pretiosum subsp. pretiosum]|uniref:Meckel syndrome type 1 protein n=1 Tax=Actinosynnema pretiosum subsp. pretiosum TaxID=103721 RepID=A0AA45L1Y1_9PSEU|nr:hypothetical protein KCV87_20730 [Actinosynnema pretiosum subsp. pretiosum]